jgi:RNA polymerase sigma factor (sigma-70 family)
MTDPTGLVERILAGDKGAFRLLIREYQRLVSHIVFRMIPAKPDQEDLCQEVFVKVYQHLDRFRFDSKLSTWIAQITYNSCLNFLEKRRLPLYDDLHDDEKPFEPAGNELVDRPDRIMETRQTAQTLRAEIDHLPPVYKTIVTLYHLDEMSYGEIAAVLKMPEGTVKSYLFRARRMLKERLLASHQQEDL